MFLISFWFSYIKGELESTVAELEESNSKLAILKVERDIAKGSTFPVMSRGNKQVASDKSREKQRDLQVMESTLKELLVFTCFSFLVILINFMCRMDV